MSVLVTPRGLPVPPQEVVDALRDKYRDDRLSLRWSPGRKCWRMLMQWPKEDRRWLEVQTGKVNVEDAWDEVASFPPDASADDILAYCDRNIQQYPDKERVSKILDNIDEHNQRRERELFQQAMDKAQHHLDAERESFYQMGLAPSKPFSGFGKGKKSVDLADINT